MYHVLGEYRLTWVINKNLSPSYLLSLSCDICLKYNVHSMTHREMGTFLPILTFVLSPYYPQNKVKLGDIYQSCHLYILPTSNVIITLKMTMKLGFILQITINTYELWGDRHVFIDSESRFALFSYQSVSQTILAD